MHQSFGAALRMLAQERHGKDKELHFGRGNGYAGKGEVVQIHCCQAGGPR